MLWAGITCDAETAAARELARGDRTPGMAAAQAEAAHKGVRYDLVVDSGHTEALDCARAIAAHIVRQRNQEPDLPARATLTIRPLADAAPDLDSILPLLNRTRPAP